MAIKLISTFISQKTKTKNKMKVTINEEQIKMLEAWAQELPTKYGMSFIQFLAQQVQEQNPKQEEELNKLKKE